MDDFARLVAWRSGDRAAGNALFERHFLVVCNFFRNKVSDGVDDLIQRTFLACIEAPHGFRGEGSFRGYLLGVARHVLLRHYREQRRDDRTFTPMVTSVCDLDPSPSVLVAGHREHARLLDGLRRIPLDLQIALELYFWEGMTMREIAEVLEVPPGTAASRLRRAKAALLEQLGGSAGAPVDTPDDLEAWARTLRSSVLRRPE